MTTTVEFKDSRLPSKFWARVQRSTNGCWHWTGRVDPKTGYGSFWVKGVGPVPAHRHAYAMLVKPLDPRGSEEHKQVDHECHNRSARCEGGPTCLHRRCVNPAHLDAKYPGLNSAASRHSTASKNRAKTHCIHGHELSGDNLGYQAGGKRYCKTCQLERANENRRKRLAKERGEGWKKVEWNSLKTHCPQGHPYDEENTYWFTTSTGTPARGCRKCSYERSRKYAESKRTGEVPPGNRADWTHCKHGHPLSGDNLMVDPKSGKRKCRTCTKVRQQAATEKRRAAREATREGGAA